MAAARTPTSVLREGVGNLTLHIATFSDIDTGDTYVSGLTGIVGQWVNATDTPTTATYGGIDVGESSGTFTFYPGEDSRTGKLYILTTQPE